MRHRSAGRFCRRRAADWCLLTPGKCVGGSADCRTTRRLFDPRVTKPKQLLRLGDSDNVRLYRAEGGVCDAEDYQLAMARTTTVMAVV